MSHRLTNAQRDKLVAQLEVDGYAVLPQKLDAQQIASAIRAIDRITDEIRGENRNQSVKQHNCVDLDPAFRALMMYEPALQLAQDCFGGMFYLCQSNFVSRTTDGIGKRDTVSASGWHADGPRPRLFPKVGGTMGLHYLKFGFFLTDLTHGNGSSLQVVRGSHLRPELDGTPHREFEIEKYKDDLVQFDCEAGTVIAFHQAQWHAAPANESEIERKNVYISYCPTWMKPLDRDTPTAESLEGLTDEERWLLGEPRPPLRWWLPGEAEADRMARFRRDSESTTEKILNYE